VFATAKNEGYEIVDGISFAYPYVAGSVVLLLQHHVKLNRILRFLPFKFWELIRSTVVLYMIPGGSFAGLLPQQGADTIRVGRLLNPNDIPVRPLFIELGDMSTEIEQSYSKSATITIHNRDKTTKPSSLHTYPRC
jgi:hypothetical protein